MNLLSNLDLINQQGRNALNSSLKYASQMNQLNAVQSRTSNTSANYNGNSASSTSISAPSSRKSYGSNSTPINKRSLDEFKDTLSLTSNQPEGNNTTEGENYIELKKLKQDHLELYNFKNLLPYFILIIIKNLTIVIVIIIVILLLLLYSSKYPNSIDVAVAVLEDIPLSWDQQVSIFIYLFIYFLYCQYIFNLLLFI